MKTDITQFLVFIFKLVLGITFIVASYPKIEDPAGFAKILYGYAVFPEISINLLAIIVPFIELVIGFSIIMRLFPQSALIIINFLLAAFIVLISFNLLRGHEFDCGCFSMAGQTGIKYAVMLLVRDLLLLGAGLFVWKNTAKSS